MDTIDIVIDIDYCCYIIAKYKVVMYWHIIIDHILIDSILTRTGHETAIHP